MTSRTTLTMKEREILYMLADGHTKVSIARETYRSTSTVRSHVTRIYEILGAHTHAQAVHLAHERGYFDKDDTEES